MIASLWRRCRGQRESNASAIPPQDSIRVPPGVSAYAIGDVHGKIDQLRRAVAWICQQAEIDKISGRASKAVFLGDYVDRGEDSAGVLELLSSLPQRHPQVEWIFLSGNHEAVMLSFLKEPSDHAAWFRFGGVETLLSYGVRPPLEEKAASLRQARDHLVKVLPASHLSFLKRLKPSVQIGDYYFAHAGVKPGVALARQKEEDLLWIRGEFLDAPQWHGACVVHGHTITAEPVNVPWRIGIDTGAYNGNPLSCVALTGQQRTIVGF